MKREVQCKYYTDLPREVKIVVAPVEADIPDERLRVLFNRWIENRSDTNGLVSCSIIETAEFVPLLRNVMLLGTERPTPFEYDYVNRIYGAEIAEYYGQDMTGKRINDFPSPVAKLVLDLYEISIDCQSPLYGKHAPPLNVDVFLWERLVLPLGDDQVDWILTVNLPKGSRKRAEAEEQAKAETPPDYQDVVYFD